MLFRSPSADEVRGALDGIATDHAALSGRADEARVSAMAARSAATQAQELADRLDRATALRSTIVDLEERRGATEADEGRIQRSRQARPVVAVADEARKAAEEADDAENALAPLRGGVIATLRALSCPSAEDPEPVPATVTIEIEQARSQHGVQAKALADLSSAENAVAVTTRARSEMVEKVEIGRAHV